MPGRRKIAEQGEAQIEIDQSTLWAKHGAVNADANMFLALGFEKWLHDSQFRAGAQAEEV